MSTTGIFKRPIHVGQSFSRLVFRTITTLFETTPPAKRSKIGGRCDLRGQVLLVGAGPGDPELITLKAYKALKNADVVLVDWLVNPDILAMLEPDCERVFVGKKCGKHSMSQQQIGELLVRYASKGLNVVRLKGGDPAIFARVAEECQILADNNIPFAILPGITSASGASAYAGIPLTHRDCAQSVRFITAHLKDPHHQPDWKKLIPSTLDKNGETLVFYMGLNRLNSICEQLIANGMSDRTPVAVIDQATTQEQQVCAASLMDIGQKVAKKSFCGPALIIVGEVVDKRFSINHELLSSEQLLSI